jgi:hypothetical protein
MSWLSKAVGGNTLKLGATILGSMVGKEYLFGETVDGRYSDESIIGSGFNKLGIPAFGSTKVGSFLSPYLEKGKDFIDFGTELAEGKRRSLQFEDLPTVPRISASGVNTNTNFQASRARMIPLGNNGKVNSALANPRVQNYLAKRARIMGLPSIQTANPTVTTKASLASTTSARRRARAKLTG